MTRGKAKDMFRNDVDSYGKPKKIMDKINRIYNDFESRTCSNCKHFSCGWCDSLCYDISLFLRISDNDFGCNKFERKP